MTNPLGSPWIPFLILPGLVLATRLNQSRWTSPGVFAPLLWSLYVFLPLWLAPEYPVSALGVWIIVALIGCFVLGTILVEGRESGRYFKVVLTPSGMKSVRRWMLLLSAVSFVGALSAFVKAVGEYGLDYSASGLFAVGHFLSVERYSGEQTPFIVRILITWVFPAAILGGISYSNSHSFKQRLLCFVPLIPAFTFSIVQAAKALTLVSVAMGLSGYLAMRMKSSGARLLVTRRAILITGATLAIGLSFFIGVDALRSHTQKDEDVQVTTDLERVKSTSLGYLAVFSSWANESDSAFHLSFGQYTFGGLLEAAGIHTRQLGIYTKMVSLDEDSNIYTAFRGLIEDFSFPGALVACILAGYIAGYAYRNFASDHAVKHAVVLAAFYAYLIWSPIGSVFVYNGPILALLVAAFVLHRVVSRSEESLLPAQVTL